MKGADEFDSLTLIRKISIALHFFVGAGAIAGGLAGILDPVSPLGMPVSVLKNGPFTDFLIPSLFLFTALGWGNIAAAILTLRKIRFYEYTSGLSGASLALWIIIQCYVMQDIVFLHVLFFVLGIAQGLLCLILLWKKNLFPASWIRKMLNHCRPAN